MKMMISVRRDNGLLLGFCVMCPLNILMFQSNILPPFFVVTELVRVDYDVIRRK